MCSGRKRTEMAWVQANHTDLMDMLETVLSEREQQDREQKSKASAYAHVCNALNESAEGMSESEKNIADAYRAKVGGGRTKIRGTANSRHYGFRIPAEGRVPNVR